MSREINFYSAGDDKLPDYGFAGYPVQIVDFYLY
jgi:hypothetical protein